VRQVNQVHQVAALKKVQKHLLKCNNRIIIKEVWDAYLRLLICIEYSRNVLMFMWQKPAIFEAFW
jgi:hypothetical protein